MHPGAEGYTSASFWIPNSGMFASSRNSTHTASFNKCTRASSWAAAPLHPQELDGILEMPTPPQPLPLHPVTIPNIQKHTQKVYICLVLLFTWKHTGACPALTQQLTSCPLWPLSSGLGSSDLIPVLLPSVHHTHPFKVTLFLLFTRDSVVCCIFFLFSSGWQLNGSWE